VIDSFNFSSLSHSYETKKQLQIFKRDSKSNAKQPGNLLKLTSTAD